LYLIGHLECHEWSVVIYLCFLCVWAGPCVKLSLVPIHQYCGFQPFSTAAYDSNPHNPMNPN